MTLNTRVTRLCIVIMAAAFAMLAATSAFAQTPDDPSELRLAARRSFASGDVTKGREQLTQLLGLLRRYPKIR